MVGPIFSSGEKIKFLPDSLEGNQIFPTQLRVGGQTTAQLAIFTPSAASVNEVEERVE